MDLNKKILTHPALLHWWEHHLLMLREPLLDVLLASEGANKLSRMHVPFLELLLLHLLVGSLLRLRYLLRFFLIRHWEIKFIQKPQDFSKLVF